MAVAAAPEAPVLTWEAYLDEGFTGGSYDILEGVRHCMPEASWKHQRIVGNVYEILRRFERERRQGHALMAPFDIVIRRFPLRTRQPDVFLLSKSRLDEAGGPPDEGPLEVAPEVVIEVLSPSETPQTLADRLQDFAMIGVQEAWIVSPEAETVQVMRLGVDAIERVGLYAFGQSVPSFVFPDLTVATAELFAE